MRWGIIGRLGKIVGASLNIFGGKKASFRADLWLGWDSSKVGFTTDIHLTQRIFHLMRLS
jgi:hypothetical protein